MMAKIIVTLAIIIVPCLSVVAQLSGGIGTFTDKRDNKTYRIVEIGNLTWMAENLNFQIDNGGGCYDNADSNCIKYGRLYTWNAAKKACEGMGGGWRLPMNEDWDYLVRLAGGEKIAGKELKSTAGWNNNKDGASGNGTDDFGFSAMPGGIRFAAGNFYAVGRQGHWWSASEYGINLVNHRSMTYDNISAYQLTSGEWTGYSVRCVVGLVRPR